MRRRYDEHDSLAALWLFIMICVIALWLTACDQTTRISITAPQAAPTVTVTGPPAAPPASPAPAPPAPAPVPPAATEPGSTNLLDPPADVDVPFNDGSNAQPTQPPVVTPCDRPGRGDGNGTPGNGKGRGDEHGKGCL